MQCWLTQRFFNRSFYILSFSALWILGEWLRSWLLTGFPWLYLGYPHIHSPFAGIAPIFGVMGISMMVALTGACFGEMYLQYRKTGSSYAMAGTYIPTMLFFLWILASLLGKITWVKPVEGEYINVGLVQANIDQLAKFDSNLVQQNLNLYEDLSQPLWDSDLIVWPETAIPFVYEQDAPVVQHFHSLAESHNATLVTGIFGRQDEELYNSITSLGEGSGIYHKQILVPFGEYVPLRGIFSTLLQIFNLPMSSLSKGPTNQAMLSAGDYAFAPFICYEVVYPDFVRRHAVDADFMVTISNDTWFGASWGPLQHLEMASMRALENGRFLVRATNNGVSAIINEKGEILSRTEQFQAEILQGEVQMIEGRTPFSRWGSWPVIIFCMAILWLVRKLDAEVIKNKLRRLERTKKS